MINPKSPTALNKHGKKIDKYGERFDSQKELDFYERFIKDQVPPELVSIHEKFVLVKKMAITPPAFVPQQVYTPDFVIRDREGNLKHVYDVKNSLGVYGIDNGNRLTFKHFARIYGIPVEAVVVRTHDFKAAAIGVTKQLNISGKAKTPGPIIRTNVNYNWREATNY